MGLFKMIKREIKYKIMRKIFGRRHHGGHYGHGYPPPPHHYGHGYRHGRGHGYRHGGHHGYGYRH
ncbi:hypothetical protein [Longispora albida]|uniref:hypothetical protein n=1 Tax=Longispora albida TaxID=203523 RepID=UPI00037CB522|nr:hypothetical protein [Longispora albida]